MDMKIILENIEALAAHGTKSTSISPKMFEKLVKYFKQHSLLGAHLRYNMRTKTCEQIVYKNIVITELNARMRQLESGVEHE